MPMKSEKQRRMLHGAKKDPALREKIGINMSAVEKMTDHDTGGRLPEKVKNKIRQRSKQRY
jgi:hypothetical protein